MNVWFVQSTMWQQASVDDYNSGFFMQLLKNKCHICIEMSLAILITVMPTNIEFIEQYEKWK